MNHLQQQIAPNHIRIYNNQTNQFPSFRTMYFFPIPAYYYMPNFSCQELQPKVYPLDKVFTPETIPASPQCYFGQAVSFKTTFEAVELKAAQKMEEKPKKTVKNIVVEEDQEYNPEGGHSKKKSSMKQIENRNIIPNVIRLIISFIQKKGKSEGIVKKLMEKWGCPEEYSLKRFYLFQNMVKTLLNSYVNEQTLKFLVQVHPEYLDIYDLEEQRFYNKITRVLIHEFVREDFYCYLMTSKRMNQQKKNLHLYALRNIRNKIHTLLAP